MPDDQINLAAPAPERPADTRDTSDQAEQNAAKVMRADSDSGAEEFQDSTNVALKSYAKGVAGGEPSGLTAYNFPAGHGLCEQLNATDTAPKALKLAGGIDNSPEPDDQQVGEVAPKALKLAGGIDNLPEPDERVGAAAPKALKLAGGIDNLPEPDEQVGEAAPKALKLAGGIDNSPEPNRLESLPERSSQMTDGLDRAATADSGRVQESTVDRAARKAALLAELQENPLVGQKQVEDSSSAEARAARKAALLAELQENPVVGNKPTVVQNAPEASSDALALKAPQPTAPVRHDAPPATPPAPETIGAAPEQVSLHGPGPIRPEVPIHHPPKPPAPVDLSLPQPALPEVHPQPQPRLVPHEAVPPPAPAAPPPRIEHANPQLPRPEATHPVVNEAPLPPLSASVRTPETPMLRPSGLTPHNAMPELPHSKPNVIEQPALPHYESLNLGHKEAPTPIFHPRTDAQFNPTAPAPIIDSPKNDAHAGPEPVAVTPKLQPPAENVVPKRIISGPSAPLDITPSVPKETPPEPSHDAPQTQAKKVLSGHVQTDGQVPKPLARQKFQAMQGTADKVPEAPAKDSRIEKHDDGSVKLNLGAEIRVPTHYEYGGDPNYGRHYQDAINKLQSDLANNQLRAGAQDDSHMLNWDQWHAALGAKVNAHWESGNNAFKNDPRYQYGGLHARFDFDMDSSGHVTNVHLKSGSGNPMYDAHCAQALVKSGQRFPHDSHRSSVHYSNYDFNLVPKGRSGTSSQKGDWERY